ncbi:MAG: hypothetical protein ACOC4G_14120 [Bacillota bacterium]
MYCSMCRRIIKIRKNQDKPFYQDLCDSCKEEYLKKKKEKKKLVVK